MKVIELLQEDNSRKSVIVFTIKETAEFLGLTSATINRYAKLGLIKAMRFSGKDYYISKKDLIEFQRKCISGELDIRKATKND